MFYNTFYSKSPTNRPPKHLLFFCTVFVKFKMYTFRYRYQRKEDNFIKGCFWWMSNHGNKLAFMCSVWSSRSNKIFTVTCCFKEEKHKLPLVVMVEGISQKMEGNPVCSKTAVYFMISFRQLCIVTVSLPLCALLICFVTAYIFQQDDIHETHCRVSIYTYICIYPSLNTRKCSLKIDLFCMLYVIFVGLTSHDSDKVLQLFQYASTLQT